MALVSIERILSRCDHSQKMLKDWSIEILRKKNDTCMSSENQKLNIVIENRLYDITKFAKVHPGGDIILQNFNECDVTDYFYSLHSDKARKMLKNMESTEVPEAHKVPPSKYLELNYKLEKEGYFKANYWIEGTQFLHTTALLLLGSYLAYTNSLLAAIFLGIGTLTCGWIGHQCDHQRNNILRDITQIFVPIFDGLSLDWWSHKHNRHHLSTNETEYDSDIQLFPFIYLWTPKKKDDAWNRSVQHIYFSALYSILHLKWQIDSLLWAFKHRNGKELICLAFHWAWYFTLPWQVWLAGVLIAGTIMAWVVTASHQAEDKLDGKRDFVAGEVAKSKYQIHDYFAHQIVTTRNIDMNSWLLNYICGGMQYQIEHHIFPRIPLYKLADVKPIVQDYCRKNGLEYKEESFWDITKRNYQNIEFFSQVKV